MIGKNAVELDLPEHIKIHKVVNVSHTVPNYEQPNDISQPVQPRPEPVPTPEGEETRCSKDIKSQEKKPRISVSDSDERKSRTRF